jgi:archaellum component FlaD/FlaE
MTGQNNTPQGGSTTPQGGSASQATAGADTTTGGSLTSFTQEQVNSIVGKARQEERAKYAEFDKYKAAFEELEERKQAEMSELDKANKALAEAQAKVASYESAQQREAWRKEVSETTGVPEAVLTAATKEEMEEQAKALGGYFKGGKGGGFVESDGFAPTSSAGNATRDLFADAIEDLL